MRSSLFGVVCLCALGCDRTAVTPVGTTLADVPALSPLSMPGGRAVGAPKGAFTKFSRTYHFAGPQIESARFEVTFERGPAALVTTNKPAEPAANDSILAVRALRIVVVENKAWAMKAVCSMPFAKEDPATHSVATTVPCTVSIARSNGRVKFESWLEISATGDVHATRGMEFEVVPD